MDSYTFGYLEGGYFTFQKTMIYWLRYLLAEAARILSVECHLHVFLLAPVTLIRVSPQVPLASLGGKTSRNVLWHGAGTDLSLTWGDHPSHIRGPYQRCLIVPIVASTLGCYRKARNALQHLLKQNLQNCITFDHIRVRPCPWSTLFGFVRRRAKTDRSRYSDSE